MNAIPSPRRRTIFRFSTRSARFTASSPKTDQPLAKYILALLRYRLRTQYAPADAQQRQPALHGALESVGHIWRQRRKPFPDVRRNYGTRISGRPQHHGAFAANVVWRH